MRARALADQAIVRGAFQKSGELQGLIDLIQSRDFQPMNILEIGTMHGGTLWLWCQLAHPQGFILSVDLPDGPFGGGYPAEVIPKLLTYTTHHQWMQLFRGNSHNEMTLKSVKRVLAGRKLSILFIDGDHTYDGVKRDWEMYSPLVDSGGLVIFHDIVKHTGVPDCDVDKFWDELKADHSHEEFICPEDGAAWGGIGVIHVA